MVVAKNLVLVSGQWSLMIGDGDGGHHYKNMKVIVVIIVFVVVVVVVMVAVVIVVVGVIFVMDVFVVLEILCHRLRRILIGRGQGRHGRCGSWLLWRSCQWRSFVITVGRRGD